MVSDKNLANAVGGKTARACDNCVRKRARWYCAADDAFLCQSCDSSVHSANPLARRHERVRLKTSSSLTKSKSLEKTSSDVEDVSVASWYSGFTRKTRSPRIKKNGKLNSGEEKRSDPLHVVPDEVSDDTSQEENVEQLHYRVPIFDPFISDLCNSSNELRNTKNHFEDGNWHENRSSMLYDDQFHGLLPSEMELADFAADVESLLGKGLENDAFDMEGLGLMDMNCEFGRGEVKVEEVGNVHDQENDHGLQNSSKPFEFKFDDCSLGVYEEENKIQPHQSISLRGSEGGEECDENKKRRILLRLDYDGVMNAWDDKRCPWTNGGRPPIESYDQCWPYCMGTCGRVHNYGGIGTMGHAPVVDGGREARVSRYREKRRTRLFSKKIRYEVRKLNAEKRPRMKGRFVKRTSFAASGFPLLNK
ncbi:hypothetical protein Leryth_021316 [Lithospermum erythrorhizon]|uniref:Uncharacterized protein n=1 Tax=Lithospermum erythrorhizon TaxID=34254 RepID=A0AAV3Q862_LITER|nr:hypothetical protein Leryth_021316 [Lithospermum erythrorhizon]